MNDLGVTQANNSTAGPNRGHSLVAADRREITVKGVSEVVSFDETAVALHTALGVLEIQGRDLKLKNLSLEGGQMEVSGHISALFYEEPKPAGGFWSRLFK